MGARPQDFTRQRGSAFRLGSLPLTVAFWTALGLFVLAMWVPRFPPSVDYPEHVAMAAVLRRWLNPTSPERLLYRLNLFTYNGVFEWCAAILALALPVELASRIVLSIIPVISAAAAVAVLDALGRPRWLAFLVVPTTYSFTLGYGFVDWALASGIGMLVFAAWLRWRSGERRLLRWIVMGALVTATGHPFAYLCLALSVAVVLTSDPSPPKFGGRAWMGAALRSLLPLAPSAVWLVFARISHVIDPNLTPEVAENGIDDPVWKKLWHLDRYALGDVSGSLDSIIFFLTVAIPLVICMLPCWRRCNRESMRSVVLSLAVCWGVLYLLTPLLWMGSWYMCHRVLQWALVFFFASTPVLLDRPRLMSLMRGAAMAASFAAAINTLVRFSLIPDQRDADLIIDDIPEGSRLYSLSFANDGKPGVEKPVWIHHDAYFLARRRGELRQSFAREYGGFPLRERDPHRTPPMEKGADWEPEHYDSTSPDSRYFTSVLVRTADEWRDENPRARIFGKAALRVKVLSHHGRFWLFDAPAAVPDG